MVSCSSLLEMYVESLKLIVWAVFVLELVMCSPPKNVSLAKLLYHENSNIKFPSNALQLSSVKFILEIFDVKQIYFNIWTPSGYFVLKWNKHEFFNKRRQEKDGKL